MRTSAHIIIIQAGGFETPAEGGTLTNFVEIGQARDKMLSLKLDQVLTLLAASYSPLTCVRVRCRTWLRPPAFLLLSIPRVILRLSTALFSNPMLRLEISSALVCSSTLSSNRIPNMLLVGSQLRDWKSTRGRWSLRGRSSSWAVSSVLRARMSG